MISAAPPAPVTAGGPVVAGRIRESKKKDERRIEDLFRPKAEREQGASRLSHEIKMYHAGSHQLRYITRESWVAMRAGRAGARSGGIESQNVVIEAIVACATCVELMTNAGPVLILHRSRSRPKLGSLEIVFPRQDTSALAAR